MKLPNGYGSVVKLGGKRRKPYAARITTSWTADGKQEKKYLGYFKTRQEAMKALADYNENPFDLASREITFADLYERWCKVKYKDKPVPNEYAAAYKKLAPLYDVPFAEIRKRHIQNVIDNLNVGYSSKSHVKALCTMMFKYAIDQEIVTTNFASLVELPTKIQSEIHKPFTQEELKILWENKNDFVAKIALILCYTGLRPIELLKIKNSDVHLEERFMRGGVKTAAGKNRIIPIAEKILPFISEMYNPKNEYLVTENKKPIHYQKFLQSYWRKNEILKSLPTKHLPHDGRHTCATMLDDAEVPLKIRQLILGHTSSDITNRVYTHKTIQQLIDAINRI